MFISTFAVRSFRRRGTPAVRLRRWLVGVWVVLTVLLHTGCANLPPAETASADDHVAAPARNDASRWHYVRFRFNRNAQGEVDSYLDAMIADQVLAAQIDAFADRLDVWRFHRRWPRDATGHQFSFMFMAPADGGEQLIERIAHHWLLRQLSDTGHLAEFRVDRPSGPGAGNIAASSDPAWPVDIQREWPHFIMGASRMWLGLVGRAAAQAPHGDLHQRFIRVEQALDKLWLDKGNQAMLHHLSALFGYKPVRVVRRDIMRF